MLMQIKMLKSPRPSRSSPMMKGAVQKHRRTIGEMLGAAGPATEKVELKEENKVAVVVEITEPAVSSELRS